VEKAPMWVRLPELPLKYWSHTSLSKLASFVGFLIMTDKNTIEKNMVNYTRMLIKTPILKKLPKHIHFEEEKGIFQL